MAESPGVLGLKVLFEGPKPCIDIVAVHGLGASPDWAWIRKVEDGNKEVHVNWLADENMLPAKLPDARIMTFNYESNWFLEAPKQRRPLCAIQLLTALHNRRKEERDTKDRPLIFIGHSFGGVVIEQSLVSANSHGGRFQYLAESTVGIIFLGTPHRGTQAGKWGEYVASTAKVLRFGSEDSILKDLREDSETLRDLLYEFTLWANRARLKIVCCFEQHDTDYLKRFGGTWKVLVVGETSACIDGYQKVPLPTDHLKINKYSGPDDPSYIAVYPSIVDIAQNAVQVVQGRLRPQTIVKDDSVIPNENKECLHSLFLSNPQDDLAAIRSAKGDRVDGTCEWILTQDRYTSWLSEDSPQLLWLSGGPGIGKTMISSFLVKELTHLVERSSQMTLAYYFCDDKYEDRKTATGILRGLLLQLLRQRPVLFRHIKSDFDVSRDRLFTNFGALWRIFVSIVEDPEAGEVCCLIDALDECEKESRQLFLTDFTKLFASQQSKRTYVKFIITSRREYDIEESLSTASPAVRNLQVDSGKINHDLSKFIDVKVDELSAMKGYTSEQKESIKSALTEKAGGTFLYVSLVLHDLEGTRIFLQVRQKLQELPSDLNKAYDRILGQIDADCEEIARLVLSWAAVSRRPLMVDELAVALALSTDESENNTMPTEDLLDELKYSFKCCEPLIYLDTSNDTIHLVHQSAKDYLLGTHLQGKDGLSQYHVVTDRTNLLIFRMCWKYLSLKEFKHRTLISKRGKDHKLRAVRLHPQLPTNHNFLHYAIQEWLEHALAASPVLANEYEFNKVNLGRVPKLRDAWLLRAAAEGEEVVVQRLLENGAELESKDSYGQTPLSFAAQKGHEAVVKLLLLSRNHVVADSRDIEGQTPLSYAAEQGHETIVKLLLDRDDVIADSEDEYDRTPLSFAAEKGYKIIVNLLLSRNDVVADSQDIRGRTPLLWAAMGGYETIVKLLLSRDDVAINSRDRYGRTTLLGAAERGHEVIVKLLLDRNDVVADSQDIEGQTPLSLAAGRGYETIVKLLLSRNDVVADSPDIEGQTPLSLAAGRGYETIVKLLLSRDDVAINSQDQCGQTPLSFAVEKGHEIIVKLLLSRDDVVADSQDRWGRTPLSFATERGHETIVKLLLSRDDVVTDSRDIKDRTPLSWAAEGGYEIIVKLLLSRSDVVADSQDTRGRTPLSWAAEGGYDTWGRTPLSWAARGGYEIIVKLLLNRSDVVADFQDTWDRTPLSWAAKGGHEIIVKLLLSRDDVAIDSRDEFGYTPLTWAVEGAHQEVVKVLEQKMVDAGYTPTQIEDARKSIYD